MDTSHLKALESLNVAIAQEARQDLGVMPQADAAYDRIMIRRAAEVRAAIALARTEGKSHYVDGVESALARAIASPRKGAA